MFGRSTYFDSIIKYIIFRKIQMGQTSSHHGGSSGSADSKKSSKLNNKHKYVYN